ncbi:SWIM zinc finger family protein [Streptomyces sp. H27-D2]|uniref:SWIM zinc finger family protein n=1 Tax=Streptomyces sp. H27-D2 TaxID=3046304 RepID=UPI002DB7EE16|nr:hypothetical protein [Streptomyces sp. H27-D2]MEC4014917.1 hypothetical protein [Streptomyces sp. H27-D2]
MTHAMGFGENDLRESAGARSFERGLGYVDAVTGLEVGDGWFTATVHGGDAYEVEITDDGDDGVSGECDCPYGLEGNFCKHCVAVGLVVLRQADLIPRQRTAAAARAGNLESWLESLDRDALLALLRQQLADDRDLRRRLELRAATAVSDIAAVRDRIADLLATGRFSRHGYVDYADSRAYGEQAGEAVAAIESLTASGQAAEAVGLARWAIRLLGEAYEQIDDSSGYVGSVAADLMAAHLDACRVARPDPEETARWLVGHQLGNDNDATDADPVDYREVLGERGLAQVRELATEAWQRKPSGWAEKYLMERLEKAEGDVDALVAVCAADLAPNGATHLRIALELDAAGREAEALAWAERGLKDTEGSVHVDSRLMDWVCARYERSGRAAEAVTVRRGRLRADRSLAAYQNLRTVARTVGCWESEREAALGLLRSDAARQRQGWGGGPVLVDALLDDGDPDAAWEAAADRADDRQWLTLADRVKDSRPADALGVYLRLAEPLKQVAGDGNYQQLARLLLGARTCHEKLGTQEEFAGYLAALRAGQKRKRNLMKILDQHGL